MKVLLIAVLMLAAAIAASGQVKEMDGSLKTALTAYDNSWNKKDAAGVSSVLADGYTYFTSNGGLTDRKRTLEFLASPDYRLTFVERSEITLHTISGDTAIVSSRWKGRGTYGKEQINDDQRCGMVFVRREKQWKLLSEHCVQIASK